MLEVKAAEIAGYVRDESPEGDVVEFGFIEIIAAIRLAIELYECLSGNDILGQIKNSRPIERLYYRLKLIRSMGLRKGSRMYRAILRVAEESTASELAMVILEAKERVLR
jgi:hypothetical protein